MGIFTISTGDRRISSINSMVELFRPMRWPSCVGVLFGHPRGVGRANGQLLILKRSGRIGRFEKSKSLRIDGFLSKLSFPGAIV